jgi:RNA polymerase sigma-70 factor (ECF subfamily)
MPKKQEQAGYIKTTGESQQVDAERLVRDNIGWMLSLAERLLRDRSLAEDVVQDSLIAALRGLAAFKGDSTLQTWLHRITTNTAISKLRQLNRFAEQSIEEFLPIFDQNECRIEPSWAHLASLSELLEIEDIRARVTEGITKLPDSYRIVLQLRDIEGYDTGETAELLGISIDNVKVRLHRSRAALKRILEPVLRGETHK